MNINGRLLLLVVVTGLFIRVWTTNDRPRWHAKNRSQAACQVWGPHPAPGRDERSLAVQRVSVTSRSTKPVEETWTLTTCPIPLPDGIVSGVYRVVDDTGRMARLEIAPSLVTTKDASAPGMFPDFCATTVASRHWYFIRLQTPIALSPVVVAPEIAPPAATALSSTTESGPPLVANRKFDFTGFVPTRCADESTNGAEVSSIEEDHRPEAPALPFPL